MKILYVSAHSNMWKVNWEDSKASVIFPTLEKAMSYARQRVASNLPGHCSQIKLMGADGTAEIVWKYEKDHYPPIS